MSAFITDNRSYDYSSLESEYRTEYDIIISMIDNNSSVIDLGCGNGSLLQMLIEQKNVTAYGIELSESGVKACIKKGLKVDAGRIDIPINLPDNSFDYAICNATIQMVMYPEVLLSEMKRIAKYQIISFPNFAYFKNRFELLFKGRMPQNMLFGFKWYDTGHIHQLSIKDFNHLTAIVGGLSVIGRRYLSSKNPLKNFFISIFPNMFDQLPIFLLKKIK